MIDWGVEAIARTGKPFRWMVLVILAVLLAYLPALPAGFIWDDDDLVYQNPHVTGEESVWSLWYSPKVRGQFYPLTYTFFRLQSVFWGLNPFGFHLSNVLLHGINVLLLYAVLARLKAPGAAWTAAVFGLHPLMAESVAWVTEAKNLLSAGFCFLSLLCFLKWEEEGEKSRFILSLGLYLLALLSKTFILTFPLVLLLLRWYQQGRVGRKYLAAVLPFFLLSLLAGGFTWYYEVNRVGTAGADWALPPAGRLLVAGRAFWFYLGKIFCPLHLSFIYPRWEIDPAGTDQWAYPVLALSFLWFLWRFRERLGRGPFAGFAFYTVSLLPALGFISFYAQIFSFVADHYAYLAIIGPVAVAVGFLARLDLPVKAAGCFGTGVLAALAVLTFSQAGTYRDLETLYRDVLAKNPDAWLAHYNLSVKLLEEDRLEEVIYHSRRALRIRPGIAGAHLNLGVALGMRGRLEESALQFSEALRLEPGSAKAHRYLGRVLTGQGKLEEAICHYREALRLKPGYGRAQKDLEEVLSRREQVESERAE